MEDQVRHNKTVEMEANYKKAMEEPSPTEALRDLLLRQQTLLLDCHIALEAIQDKCFSWDRREIHRVAGKTLTDLNAFLKTAK